MAGFPRPNNDEIVLTHVIVTSDVERSRRFSAGALAGEVLLEIAAVSSAAICATQRGM